MPNADSFHFSGDLVKTNRLIYTPSPFARANLLHLQEVGQLAAVQPHASSRSGLGSYLFFLVESGSGTLTYGGTRHPMRAGACGFIDCRNAYSQQSSNDLWTLRWVHFNGAGMAGIYTKYLERGGRVCFYSEHFAAYAALLGELFAIADSTSYTRDMQIAEKLMSLLTLLMEDSWHPETDRRTAPKLNSVQAVKEYLDAHYIESVRLDELAAAFYINKFYLTRAFKEQYGVSINSYLAQLRVTHAKELLRFTSDSISQIAAQCGYDDMNYFARVFKKVEGVPPREYRSRW